MKIDDYIVNKKTELIEVMKKIDNNSQGIVFVTNEKEVLCGVITDGDIRRHILKNRSINCLAESVMNFSPKFSSDENSSKIKQILDEFYIRSLPILNKEGKIVNIFFREKIQNERKKLNIPLVIMAGGKGTRLYPYTQVLPKPLIPINDKTITEIIIDNFNNFGCDEIYMIVNYKKNLIKAYFNESESNHKIHFIDENNFQGTAGGLKMLEPYLSSTFFLNNCDVLIKEDYSEMLKYHKQSKNIITVVCALKKEIIPYGTIETDETGQIVNLVEKPDFDFLINTGLYIIEPKLFKKIPEDTFIHITDVIQDCINEGLKVGVYPISEENWMDMGQLEELESMRKRLNER